MKRMKKAVLNKAEGRAAHKFQFELTPTSVGALDRVLKGPDGSSLFVQEPPSESNACRHTASTARGCGPRDLRLQPMWCTAAASGALRQPPAPAALALSAQSTRGSVDDSRGSSAGCSTVGIIVGAHLATGDPRAQGRGLGARHGRR